MKSLRSCLRLLAACGAMVCATSLMAQADNSFDGSWAAEWKTPAGRLLSATLQLKDGAGTWHVQATRTNEDPCSKLAAPATVVVREGQPYLQIKPGEVIAGCTSSLLKLTKSADGQLKGNWRDGRDVTISRQ